MEYGEQDGTTGLDFNLEPDTEIIEEEYYRDDQCAALTSPGHMECARTFRFQMPEPVRFSVSSFFGSVAMFLLNELALEFLAEDVPERITVAWTFSYGASIWLQHWLHSTLVYGWQTSYKAGLIATYAGYSVSYALSIPINAALVVGGANAEIAWAGTLVLTGIANYFLFSYLLGGGGKKKPNVTPRGLYQPSGGNSVSQNPLGLNMLEEGTSPTSGREMAREYRRLAEEHRVQKLSNADRFYVWIASW